MEELKIEPSKFYYLSDCAVSHLLDENDLDLDLSGIRELSEENAKMLAKCKNLERFKFKK